MSLFNSAIRTLSSMAIQESANVPLPRTASQSLLEEVQATLDSMPYASGDDTRFLVEMVPVRKSKTFQRYLIEMEDLSRYMITNGIRNAKEAVCNILEANNLHGQFHNVAVIIDEASLMEELSDITSTTDNLGHNFDGIGTLPQPPKGLGIGMIRKDNTDGQKFRAVANSKQMMDLLTGRYGIPLIKKNYQQEGLLESAEDVQLKVKDDEKIIHEGDKKKNPEDMTEKDVTKKDDANEKAIDAGTDDISDDDLMNDLADVDIVDTVDDDMDGIDYDNMDAHELHIQRLKDIANGKYDNDDEW